MKIFANTWLTTENLTPSFVFFKLLKYLLGHFHQKNFPRGPWTFGGTQELNLRFNQRNWGWNKNESMKSQCQDGTIWSRNYHSKARKHRHVLLSNIPNNVILFSIIKHSVKTFISPVKWNTKKQDDSGWLISQHHRLWVSTSFLYPEIKYPGYERPFHAKSTAK